MKIRRTTPYNNTCENNWKSKSFEALEKDYWPDLNEPDSYLVTTCHSLRKKQVHAFSIEDLRILIGQTIGLKYLVPLAIDKLELDAFAEDDYYEVDLLHSVFTSDQKYWLQEKSHWLTVCNLMDEGIQRIKNEADEQEICRILIIDYMEFKELNS